MLVPTCTQSNNRVDETRHHYLFMYEQWSLNSDSRTDSDNWTVAHVRTGIIEQWVAYGQRSLNSDSRTDSDHWTVTHVRTLIIVQWLTYGHWSLYSNSRTDSHHWTVTYRRTDYAQDAVVAGPNPAHPGCISFTHRGVKSYIIDPIIDPPRYVIYYIFYRIIHQRSTGR